MISDILSFIAIVWGIVNFILLWRQDKKYQRNRSPLDWKIELYAFKPNQDLQNNSMVTTYEPTVFEVIINRDEESHINCNLSQVTALNCLNSERRYEFIFIRNTSQNAIELLSFALDKSNGISINHILLAGNSVLLALPSHGKPSGLIINYGGTPLNYSIKSSTGFLRPIEIR